MTDNLKMADSDGELREVLFTSYAVMLRREQTLTETGQANFSLKAKYGNSKVNFNVNKEKI